MMIGELTYGREVTPDGIVIGEVHMILDGKALCRDGRDEGVRYMPKPYVEIRDVCANCLLRAICLAESENASESPRNASDPQNDK